MLGLFGGHGESGVPFLYPPGLGMGGGYPGARGGVRGGGGRSGHEASMAALREAMGGLVGGRLPPELLFSDRDFTDADYELLLALDEGVENRKGECVCTWVCPCDARCMVVVETTLQLMTLVAIW